MPSTYEIKQKNVNEAKKDDEIENQSYKKGTKNRHNMSTTQQLYDKPLNTNTKEFAIQIKV